MSTSWEVDKRLSPKQKNTNPTTDLLEIGFKGITDTLNIVDKLMSNAFQSNSSKSSCLCECMDPRMDCYTCGPLKSDTDLKLEARLGERRVLFLLVENNKNVPQQVTVQTNLIMDACGNTPDAIENILISPTTFVIPACQCQRLRIAIDVATPFQDGMVYYVEIRLTGECIDELVTLGIWVQPDHYADHYVLVDPCRPKKGKFVEFHNCDCGCCSEPKTYYVCDETQGKTPHEHREG